MCPSRDWRPVVFLLWEWVHKALPSLMRGYSYLVWELDLWGSVEGVCGSQIIPLQHLWEEHQPVMKDLLEEILGICLTINETPDSSPSFSEWS